MGITFRSGDYVKFVRFGHRTIKDGEAAAIWNARGELTQVVGPRRVTLWFSTIRFLYHYQATRGQYLKVENRDGTTDHLVGPVALYHNPTHHKSIQVMNAHNLATQDDCIVILGSRSSSGSSASPQEKEVFGETTDCRVVFGPQFVIPSDHETVYTFGWSHIGQDGEKNGCLIPTSFHVLTTNKMEQWKLRLELKTEEGATVHVHLAVSYKIETVEKCLKIADPVAYVFAAILCDANRGDNVTLANVAKLAGEASTYKSFGEAMQAVGFRILQLHVLDISLPSAAQDSRQQAKHDAERQSKATAQLECDVQLAKLDFEKKRIQAEGQAALDKAQQQLNEELESQARDVRMAAMESELQMLKSRAQASNEVTQQANSTQLEFWRGLQNIGVDVTQVLVAQAHAHAAVAAHIYTKTAAGYPTEGSSFELCPNVTPALAVANPKREHMKFS